MHPWEVEVLRAMDMIRVHVWNTKKKPDEPDLLVAISDSKGIGALLRNAWKGS